MQKDLSYHIAKSVPGFDWFTFLDFQLRCHQIVRQGQGVEPSAFSRRFFAFSAFSAFFCRFFRRCPLFPFDAAAGGRWAGIRTAVPHKDKYLDSWPPNPNYKSTSDRKYRFPIKVPWSIYCIYWRPPNHNNKPRLIITSKSSLIIISKSKPFKMLKSLSSIKAWKGKGAFQTPPFNDHIRSGHFGLQNLLHILRL